MILQGGGSRAALPSFGTTLSARADCPPKTVGPRATSVSARGAAGRLLVLLLVTLFGCGRPDLSAPVLSERLPFYAATDDSSAAVPVDSIIQEFLLPEAQLSVLSGLPFAPDRAYALLVQIPGPGTVDLTRPTEAQRELRRFLNPIARWRAGSALGHAAVGWRCADDTRLGLVAKSGERNRQGLRLLLAGWGLAAFISDYHDGFLDRPFAPRSANAGALGRGQARIVAFEIPQAGCEEIRQSLRDYITAAEPSVELYTMRATAQRPLGEGCGGFAMWLALRGGVFAGLQKTLMRPVALSDRYIGTGREINAAVTPYRAAPDDPPGPVGVLQILCGDWEDGRDLGNVEVMDMELMLIALERAYARAGPDFAFAPRVSSDDVHVQAVAAKADKWLARYRRVTPVHSGQARAVVLHLD